MTVTVTFTHDDPREIRHDMAAFLGVQLTPSTVGVVTFAVSDASSDKPAEQPVTETPAPKRGRKAKAELPPPGVTVLPVTETADPSATAAQDKADEKADTAAQRPADKTYTLDDVRNAAKPYIDKHGMAAAQSDLMDALADAVPGKRKISELDAGNQAELKKAVEAFEAAAKGDARYVKKAAA